MEQYQTFIFESFNFDPATGKVELNYSLDGEIKFTETLTIPLPKDGIKADEKTINAALFALHIIGGVSYFKTCLPPKIEVRSGELTKSQAEFFKNVYEEGLGEFYFKNQIDFREKPVEFNCHPERSRGMPQDTLSPFDATQGDKVKTQDDKSEILVPIGGGKDSMVTIELLKKAGKQVTLFRLGSHPVIEELAEIAGLPLINVKRCLSPTLFDLNEQGALNGHVPITAYVSFVSILVGLIHGQRSVAFSNERSASYGNVEYLGKQINHQWSKSLEFEGMLQNYISENIDPEFKCFSLLRPYSELKIVELFTKYPEYFEVATSCNANWRILKEKPAELWSNDPKSAFVFALYSAFLGRSKVEEIFGANLFDTKELLATYKELLGAEGFKPFECVGTPDETKAAFYLAHQKNEWEDTAALKYFVSEVLPKIDDPEKLVDDVMLPSDNHLIPVEFKSLI